MKHDHPKPAILGCLINIETMKSLKTLDISYNIID